MLVLRRKKDEEIIVTVPGVGQIKIRVTHIQKNGKTVQIGVEAPMGCDISRNPD